MTPDGGASSGEILHASCVAVDGRALLIRGAAGSGKSALALELMAFGAGLIADDRCALRRQGDRVIAAAPDSLPPFIEARFLGLLRVGLHPPAAVAAVVDMDRDATSRLPAPAFVTLLGLEMPLFAGRIGPHLGASLLQLLKTGLAPAP